MLDRRTLPLSGLRAFDSAARHLHFQKAGEELGVTQSAISHQVRALERTLETSLFERTNNRLSLSPAGRQLLESTTAAFDRLIEGIVRLAPDTIGGTLVLGCTASLMVSQLVAIISQFRDVYPEIDLEVVEIKPLQKDIPKNIEVAVCFGRPRAENRRVELLLEEQLYPVCSPRLLHGRKPVNRPADLLQLPLLHNDLGYWPHWIRSMGLGDAQAAQNLHLFNTHLTLFAARQGLGVALATPLEVNDALRDGALVKVLDRSIPEINSYYLVAHPTDAQTRRAAVFEAWLKESVGRVV